MPARRPWPVPPHRQGAGTGPVDPAQAEEFLRLFHADNPSAGPARPRIREVTAQIARFGTYVHTAAELEYGARVAWRNSGRCIGRLYWRSLRIRDRRAVETAEGVARECVRHLREATCGGRIRPTITVFAQDRPGRPGPRIWNEQLVRYAGHRGGDGVVLAGDARNAALTATALRLGWPGGRGTDFDVLPLVVEAGGAPPLLAPVPDDAVLEVPLEHPAHPWFAGLGLRWHAVPAISNMCLEIGGVCYPCAPFNGWYMGTEIGARNLADEDRYNRLGAVAEGLGLDTSSDRTLWKDQALVELNVAVLHSFARAGVTISDHHTEARRFITHLEREERSGRVCPADWSWIVPPLSGALTPVFHRYYDDVRLSPAFVHHPRKSEHEG
ncbi:nitric oxide synthase oxygenase [Sphaerisporangium siamense]|uniref:Nitric oxide synthase oxygenase n=1 Tax=Sphaerisporangium siamense TaxID=795645 RepID=A0A7W7DE39_9ACTN|nr:nitric oxide synthase oxygenase [Sphaerisporangium siamense]MBB4705133.1 nitric-oxide synthase [Sphaerisporangium siamense]GII83940.1 nitric oxide synthase oxygenase [Sphaerisporangium siamense]